MKQSKNTITNVSEKLLHSKTFSKKNIVNAIKSVLKNQGIKHRNHASCFGYDQ